MNTPAPINHAAPYRGPIEAVRICLRKYVDFDGRASRSEFWWFALFILLCEVCMIAMRLMWQDWRSYMPSGMSRFIVFAAFLLPAMAVAARRLHDTGRGDWRLLFFFLPAAVFISAMILRFEYGIYVFGWDDKAGWLESWMTLLMWFPVIVYAGSIIVAFFMPSMITIMLLRITPFWMFVAIYILLASVAYRLAKTDNATQNGFYFDGLPKFEKRFILLVLALPVLYGISRMDPVLDMLMSFIKRHGLYPHLFFAPTVITTVATFTYWWIQQGNPAQNKYDQTKTLRIKKWFVAGLPAAVVINHVFFYLLHYWFF